MLGLDWLSQYNCRRDFKKNIIEIDGKSVNLCHRPRTGGVRRIYAEQDTSLPAAFVQDVPVRMMLSSLQEMSGDWALEPRQICPGILASRTLMKDTNFKSTLRIINASDKNFIIRRGTLVGKQKRSKSHRGARRGRRKSPFKLCHRFPDRYCDRHPDWRSDRHPGRYSSCSRTRMVSC